MDAVGRGQDLEGTRGFLRSATAQAAADNGFSAAIVDGNAIVGIVGFHHVDWDHRSTSIGYWLGRDAQGRGTATQAVGALLAHAFERWDLNRVELRAAPENARSRAVAERLGFVEEGVLREAERHRDGYRDLVLYSMLAAEWRSSPARR